MRTMNVLIFYIFALTIALSCQGMPIGDQALNITTNPELTAGYFQGDIILNHFSRNGMPEEAVRWPNKTVYYRISDDFDAEHRAHIMKAIDIIERASCIIFDEASPHQKNYVDVVSTEMGCLSHLGYGNTVQILNLQPHKIDDGCFILGTIVHEFLHTLGFYHQHSASNRDEYVQIIRNNIMEENWLNFVKERNSVDFGVEYDYGSIMHYRSTAFSKNTLATIVALKPGGENMGQRTAMSQSDIKKLNRMYNCPTNT